MAKASVLLGRRESLAYLDMVGASTGTHQVADYRMQDDDLPPCFCEGGVDDDPCIGDCPYCRMGGFGLHNFWGEK
jgi:hypothetical protein